MQFQFHRFPKLRNLMELKLVLRANQVTEVLCFMSLLKAFPMLHRLSFKVTILTSFSCLTFVCFWKLYVLHVVYLEFVCYVEVRDNVLLWKLLAENETTLYGRILKKLITLMFWNFSLFGKMDLIEWLMGFCSPWSISIPRIKLHIIHSHWRFRIRIWEA